MSNRRTQRKAYFQGAQEASKEGNITSNDPTKLGYGSKDGIQYDRKPMAVPVGEDARPYEQKAFEGAAAKTKVNFGPAGEEFDLKKHWLRIPEDAKIANAKVVGGFTKQADAKNSFWTLYVKNADGSQTPILKASLVDLWGNKLSTEAATEMGIPQHADKEIWNNKEISDTVVAKSSNQHYFNMVAKEIKKEGFSATAYLMTGHEGFLKRAANGGKVTKAQMGYGQEELSVPAEGAAPMGAEAPALDGGIADALDHEAETTAGEADVTVELLAQKHEELESAQTNLVEKTAPEETSSVFMQLQDAEKMVDEAKEEMAMAALKLRDKTITASQKIKFIKLTAEAQEDAIDTLSGSDDVISKAEEAVKKADDAIKQSEEVAGGAAPEGAAPEAMMEETVEAPAEAPVAEESMSIEAALKSNKAAAFVKAFLNKRAEGREDASYEQGKYGVRPEGAPKDGKDEINIAHPEGGHQVSDLTAGGKPEDNGGRFDTVTEAQDHDLKVADKMPTGELSGKSVAVASSKDARVTKLAELIKSAEADSATKEFWGKLLWGQSDADGKAFGKDLTKDFEPGGNETGKAVAAATAETEAKVVRAYELVDEAVDKGFVEKTAEAKSKLVKEVMAFDDKAFIAFKNVIDSAKKPTVASVAPELIARASKKIPNIGQVDSVEKEEDFTAKLINLGWK